MAEGKGKPSCGWNRRMGRGIGPKSASRWPQEKNMVDWCHERRENQKSVIRRYVGAKFNLYISLRGCCKSLRKCLLYAKQKE